MLKSSLAAPLAGTVPLAGIASAPIAGATRRHRVPEDARRRPGAGGHATR